MTTAVDQLALSKEESVNRDLTSPAIFKNAESFQNSLKELNKMRMKGIFCNAILETEDKSKFRVHKVAMSWCSSYFRTLFTTAVDNRGPGKESQPKSHFLIPNISSRILEIIIKFAYSGMVEVNEENVNDLLPAADQFNVPGIVGECTTFVLQNITSENCLGIWRFGKEYFMPQLESEARKYIMQHFSEITTSSEEFLYLKPKYLKELLEDNYLNISNESFVWTAIKRWCQFKYPQRLTFMPSLLICVRMALLPIEVFKEIMNDPRAFRNPRCRSYIYIVSKYILSEMRDLARVSRDKRAVALFTPRYPFEVIFTFGGWSLGGPTAVFEVYDCRADLWKMMFIDECLGPRVYHQTITLGDYMYVIGGSSGRDFLNSCWRFDIQRMKFEEVSPMQERRCFLSAVLSSNKIYAIGGYNGLERLRTVEYFDPVENKWSYATPMHETRSDASASSLRNRIFVVGGFDGSDFLSSAECYYTEFDQWFLLPPMLKCRSGVGCIALDNAIYAIGGFDGVQRLNSVEKYCVKNKQWFHTKPMRLARSNFAVTHVERKIYVMGGYDDINDTTTDQSEVFDPSNPNWHSIASLNVGRSGLSSCTVLGISDHLKYIKDNRYRCLLKNVSKEETIDLSDAG